MTVNSGDLLRVTAVYGVAGVSQYMNVFDIDVDLVAPQPDNLTMLDLEAYMTQVYGAATAMFSTDIQPVEIRAFNATQNKPMPVQAWTTWPGGSSAGERLPDGVAGLVVFRTDANKVLGRKFVGGITEDGCLSGVYVAGTMTALGAWAGALAAGYTSASGNEDYVYVVVDKLGIRRIVVTAVLRNIPAYQRRRKPGVGV